MKGLLQMEIIFENKKEDMEAFADYFLTETEEGKKISRDAFGRVQAWLIIYPALFGMFFWGAARGAWIVPLFITVGLFVFNQIYLFLRTGFKPGFYYGKKIYKNQEKALTPKDLELFQLKKTLTINDVFLEVRSSAVLHQWKWIVIDSIAITRNHIFICIGKNFTLYIPKRSFQSEQSFIEFWNKLVEQKERNSQSM
jgi:hypothetical protein